MCDNDPEAVRLVCCLSLLAGSYRTEVDQAYGTKIALLLDGLKTQLDAEKRANNLLVFMDWAGLAMSVQTIETVYKTVAEKATRNVNAELPSVSASSQPSARVAQPNTCIQSENGTSKVHLITQFFVSNDETRTLEALMALRINLMNECVFKCHVLLEKAEDALLLNEENLGTENLSKILKIELGRRMKFSDAWEYINFNLGASDVAILSNSDIIFERDSLSKLVHGGGKDLLKNSVLALTRWEVGRKNGIPRDEWKDTDYQKIVYSLGRQFQPRIDSQDSWVVLGGGQIPQEVVERSNFWLGLPRCDGRVAKIFSDAGISVKNPSFSGIQTLHIEGAFKTLYQERDKGYSYLSSDNVLGDTQNVPIDIQWDM